MRNNLPAVLDEYGCGEIKVVFDIGAHTGEWARYARRLLPNASIFCVEANPQLKQPPGEPPRGGWANAVLSAPEITEVAFYATGGTGDSYLKELTPHYDNVRPLLLPATTLDDLAIKKKWPPPQLLKLDTQGSELDILRGSTKTLKSVKILVAEVPVTPYNQGAPSFDAYVTFMCNLGFTVAGLEEEHFVSDPYPRLVQLDLVFRRP